MSRVVELYRQRAREALRGERRRRGEAQEKVPGLLGEETWLGRRRGNVFKRMTA